MSISFWIDNLTLFALIGAVIYGVILSRRIARLQAALLELAPALQAFCDAVEQSEESVAQIRTETDRMETLQRRAAERPAPPARGPAASRADLVRNFFETARARQ